MVAEMEEILTYNSDDEVAPVEHNKLLSVISKLYDKKRVGVPSRNEPSLEVSEFHLTQAGDHKKERVQISSLAQVLKKRAGQVEISKKLRLAQKKAKTLPKPLEKPQAQKIVREVGYENVRKQLNRWDAIVYNQRVAEQVTFPLKSSTVHEHKSDFLSRFRTSTPLEQEVERILKESSKLSEERQKEMDNQLAQEIEEGNSDEEEFPLTLEEIMERRQLVGKMRAQMSYKQYKARRQNKIKSKKYHRILKRQRIKDQIREFEELQKKDPEAALKKLEQLEKTRAEERVSLRHRSTGQWAKNQAVRAKYNKEARIALAEQLAKSRELTSKIRLHKDSSDEEGDNQETEVTVEDTDKTNPWTSKAQNEVEAFSAAYRKFWDEKNKETDKNTDGNKAKNDEIENLGSANTERNGTVRRKVNSISKNSGLIRVSMSNNEETSPVNAISAPSLNQQNSFLSDDQSDEKINRLNGKIGSETEDESVSNCNSLKKVKGKKNKSDRSPGYKYLSGFNTKEILNNSGCWIVFEEVKSDDNKVMVPKEKKKSGQKEKKELSGNTLKGKKIFGRTATNVRPEVLKSVNIGDVFDEMEDKIRTVFENKASALKEQLSHSFEQDDDEEFPEGNNGNENNPSLEMSKQILVADVDEELEESSGNKQEQKSLLDKIPKVVKVPVETENKKETSQSDDIDPNKFFSVISKQLKSKLPDLITEGEDALDDEEQSEEDRHLTISEAFADDDVVDTFRKEKDEEIKKNVIEDVDLSLPGWGQWAGHSIEKSRWRKRKKIAFNIPEKLPRKDDSKFNVIINEDMDAPLKEHRVNEIPYPFTSIQDFEASIRAPVGRNWVPQIAHRKLIAPPVVTKLGTVIEPMDEDQLVKQKELNVMDRNNKFSKRENRKL